jgi:hypothetical protein
MKICDKCGSKMRIDSLSDVCKPCLRICHCGTSKDHRAAECQPCAMKRKALIQWQTDRDKMLASIRDAMKAKRFSYSDISLDVRWEIKPDGRRYRYYWDGDRQRSIYRYQWVWQQAHGAIPKGCEVHHKNHNCSDDRLDNLELKNIVEHRKHHGAMATIKAPTYTCATCKTLFKAKTKKERPIRYCSKDCWYHRATSLAVLN